MKRFYYKTLPVILVLLLSTTICSGYGISTIVVNQNHPNASNDNEGTEDYPFESFGPALYYTRQLFDNNETKTIVIHEGIYREDSLFWSDPEDIHTRLVVKAYEDDEVIISGSEIWNGWEHISGTDYYTHSWEFDWGLLTEQPGWDEEQQSIKTLAWIASCNDLLVRREMLIVNGERYAQVLTEEELFPGAFYVDEDYDIITMEVKPGTDMQTAVVEVPNAGFIFRAVQSDHIKFEGITFQHTNGYLGNAAFGILNCDRIVVENCKFLNNNWTGIDASSSTNVTYRNLESSDNGALGFGGFRDVGLRIIDCETYRNNWRGYAAGTMTWALGGMKVLEMRDVEVIGHTSRYNYTRGMWFDTNNENISIIDSDFSENYHDGIFFEASQGPFLIEGCYFGTNAEAAVAITCAEDVTVNDCIMEGNQYGFFISGTERTFYNHILGDTMTTLNIGSVVTNNIITALEEGQDCISSNSGQGYWQMFLDDLVWENNVWTPYDGGDDAAGPELGVEDNGFAEIPEYFGIIATYPNPFNATITATVALPIDSHLNVSVFNILGQNVETLANDHYMRGYHNFIFDGTNLASGFYFFHAQNEERRLDIKKVGAIK